MANWQSRQRDVIRQFASLAWNEPLQSSGLWRHDDIRNNLYYASYLVAAASDSALCEELALDPEAATAKAVGVLARIVNLQDKDPASATFGHWPLGLGERPEEARPNPLPAELMGVLIAYFQQRFGSQLPASINQLLDESVEALFRSSYYRAPLTTFGHHEAKYTATKLIFGHRFKDRELLASGRLHLQQTLDRVRTLGMPEYGALPWFWHWIQAFTCAYECVGDDGMRLELAALLDELWRYRATYYLKGAWTGGRMRSLGHDLPRDGNVAFDYVQFGDFSLPSALPRVEYAGLLFYQAPESARQTALDRALPQVIQRIVMPAGDGEEQPIHSSLFVDEGFAMGGIWERVKEFDNEQHRWGIDFPLRQDEGVNRLYVLPPGDGYVGGDPRHAGETGHVLFHRNAIIALYPFAEGAGDMLVGVLPRGEWIPGDNAVYGYVEGVFIALHMLHGFSLEEEHDRIKLTSAGLASGGVVVEAISAKAALRKQLRSLADFAAAMAENKPLWAASEDEPLRVEYTNLDGDRLAMTLGNESQRIVRTVNGSPIVII
ncbi:hypothetical protein [Paenibacillus harenae]|uniref:hypothetical protein n=1 Tax=Paenibacillus harenae TaxID=306543 RepID=UPI00278F9CBC|nr:hypothetical protein [Paenibacillus harenae]MDQ0058679.1 hypothetical protein [Paenibacillus harenae]